MKRSSTFACLATTTLAFGALTVLAPAATAGAGHCDPSTLSCGANPALTGPPPPFVTIPANCPGFLSTDPWILAWVSGNAVMHGVSNKNGDWGGFTAEGQATLTTSDNTVEYTGHLTEWGGGGNNSAGQSENGFTVSYNGSGIAGNITIHADIHTTTNNAGTTTSNVTHATVTCS